ncbi:MAG: hypothetical protein QM645_03695 [Asticcacaulis sp.]
MRVLCATALASLPVLLPATSFAEPLLKPFADLRYRYEQVTQDNRPETAEAYTLRLKAGVETLPVNGFSFLIEGEVIRALGPVRFNDTINGKAAYPVVADPDDALINRLQLSYTQKTNRVVLGRQIIAFDNQRHLGAVGWRQNDQTFDGLSVKMALGAKTTLEAAYVFQVNRVFGTRSAQGTWDDSEIYLARVSHSFSPAIKLSGFVQALDIPDAPVQSGMTTGIVFEGVHSLGSVKGALRAEYAYQKDYGANPDRFGLDYFSVEPSLIFGSVTVKATDSVMEGDGISAFQFPLGTNHAFSGWADMFLTTPVNGLKEQAVSVAYGHKSGVRVQGALHRFQAERGGQNYGSEFNLLIEKLFAKRFVAGLKYADYRADGFGTDTQKIMPYVQVKY